MRSFHLLITHAPLSLFLNKTLQKKWRDQDSNTRYCGHNTDHQDVMLPFFCSKTYTSITPINEINTQSDAVNHLVFLTSIDPVYKLGYLGKQKLFSTHVNKRTHSSQTMQMRFSERTVTFLRNRTMVMQMWNHFHKIYTTCYRLTKKRSLVDRRFFLNYGREDTR